MLPSMFYSIVYGFFLFVYGYTFGCSPIAALVFTPTSYFTRGGFFLVRAGAMKGYFNHNDTSSLWKALLISSSVIIFMCLFKLSLPVLKHGAMELLRFARVAPQNLGKLPSGDNPYNLLSPIPISYYDDVLPGNNLRDAQQILQTQWLTLCFFAQVRDANPDLQKLFSMLDPNAKPENASYVRKILERLLERQNLFKPLGGLGLDDHPAERDALLNALLDPSAFNSNDLNAALDWDNPKTAITNPSDQLDDQVKRSLARLKHLLPKSFRTAPHKNTSDDSIYTELSKTLRALYTLVPKLYVDHPGVQKNVNHAAAEFAHLIRLLFELRSHHVTDSTATWGESDWTNFQSDLKPKLKPVFEDLPRTSSSQLQNFHADLSSGMSYAQLEKKYPNMWIPRTLVRPYDSFLAKYVKTADSKVQKLPTYLPFVIPFLENVTSGEGYAPSTFTVDPDLAAEIFTKDTEDQRHLTLELRYDWIHKAVLVVTPTMQFGLYPFYLFNNIRVIYFFIRNGFLEPMWNHPTFVFFFLKGIAVLFIAYCVSRGLKLGFKEYEARIDPTVKRFGYAPVLLKVFKQVIPLKRTVASVFLMTSPSEFMSFAAVDKLVKMDSNFDFHPGLPGALPNWLSEGARWLFLVPIIYCTFLYPLVMGPFWTFSFVQNYGFTNLLQQNFYPGVHPDPSPPGSTTPLLNGASQFQNYMYFSDLAHSRAQIEGYNESFLDPRIYYAFGQDANVTSSYTFDQLSLTGEARYPNPFIVDPLVYDKYYRYPGYQDSIGMFGYGKKGLSEFYEGVLSPDAVTSPLLATAKYVFYSGLEFKIVQIWYKTFESTQTKFQNNDLLNYSDRGYWKYQSYLLSYGFLNISLVMFLRALVFETYTAALR